MMSVKEAVAYGQASIVWNPLFLFQIVLMVSFSSRTTSLDIQRNLEANVEKRTKDTYGPPMGKRLLVFMDDMNMPKVIRGHRAGRGQGHALVCVCARARSESACAGPSAGAPGLFLEGLVRRDGFLGSLGVTQREAASVLHLAGARAVFLSELCSQYRTVLGPTSMGAYRQARPKNPSGFTRDGSSSLRRAKPLSPGLYVYIPYPTSSRKRAFQRALLKAGFIHPSMRLSILPSIHPSMHLSTVNLFMHLPIHHPSIHVPTYPSLYLASVCPSAPASIPMFLCPSCSQHAD